MPKVWKCKDGPDPTRGGPLARLSIEECQNKLGLTRDSRFIGGPDARPMFFADDGGLASYTDFRHIVVEIDESEAQATGWRAGFYYLPELSVAEAARRIG